MQRMTEKEIWEAASAAIRATGARTTSARTRVLAVLLDTDRALTEPQIEMRLSGPALDCVTVYRVLEWLVDVRLAHRVPGSDGIWRFAPIEEGRTPHAVFECLACGALLPLRDAPAVDPAVPPGFITKSAIVHIHGTCATCAATATAQVAASDEAVIGSVAPAS